jgi:lysophospholipase L1-like esterase
MANKLVVVCNEGGQYLTYRSDAHGFNNPQYLWDSAPVDIVAVGDSFVQGWCVPPDDNFVAVIRKRYPATLNLGVEGNGPLVMLATIKEYAEIVKPKVVLWFYFEGNDIMDLRRESKSPLLRRYLEEGFSQGLFARQAEIDRVLDEYIKTARDKNRLLARLEEMGEILDQLPAKTKGILVLSQLRQQLGLIQGTAIQQPRGVTSGAVSKYQAEIELLGKILSRAKETVSRWGGTLYFVYLPVYHRYVPGHGGDLDRDQVLRVVRNAGLPIIDIHQTFVAQGDPLALFPWRLPSHYNEKGHQLVADEVLRSISVNE